MRKIQNINDGWRILSSETDKQNGLINLPFTWNAQDGQDGGGDYKRGVYIFEKTFQAPKLGANERLYLEFKGVNSSAEVYLNGTKVTEHDGGYSTFRTDITDYLQDINGLRVFVDNSKTEKVYPQTADFTFYGGIYRDVNLITVNKNHFDLDFFGAHGIKIESELSGTDGLVKVTAYITGEGNAEITIQDKDGTVVAQGTSGETLTVKSAHLWNGIDDPYLYSAKANLTVDGETVDEVALNFGFRTFAADPKKGFLLNGKPYPLRGVCRHQDRKAVGNAITKAEHEEDIELIREIGANTIRLAHYQHDDYFYDLCDKYGLVVWAEIPYISRHMPEANQNAVSQMKELICQQHHHASIAVWGISNEITMYRKHKKDMLALHKRLNELCHGLDPTRLTTVACFAMCSYFNKSAHITDLVSWNLYLGWYVPGKFLNDIWIKFFRLFYPKRCIGYSEYGAEAMPNLHSKHPKRGDNSEEYQADYHEYMLRFFDRNPYLWATHVWNMFDFAADARNQGGEPGMNHKGLVTFDRKIKKDSFYLYKAYWSKEPFVHIAGKRFANRTGKSAKIMAYTNTNGVKLTHNGKPVKGKTKDGKVYKFKIKLAAANELTAYADGVTDSCVIYKVEKPDPAYKLHVKSETQSWQK